MVLALQIILLLIGVGGALVTAWTLANSRAKWMTVATFGLAGVAGLVLTILTYNQVTITSAANTMAGSTEAAWAYVRTLVQNRSFQITIALFIGIVIGMLGPRLYRKAIQPKWYASYDIFKLADQRLLKEAIIAEGEVQKLAAKIIALSDEREKLGLIPSAVPHATNKALALIHDNIREAYARNAALHELREKSRARARDDLYAKLRDGRLVARGFAAPMEKNSKEITIPSAHWRLIQFSGDYTEASSNSVRYVGLEVARRGWF